MTVPAPPRDPWPDSTVAFLREGYDFAGNHARRLGTDVFGTRLALQRTICMTGPEAAELFYDETRFKREMAAPGWLRQTLFGPGGVQELDGEAHRHRKRMFMELLTGGTPGDMAARCAEAWRARATGWQPERPVVLLEEAREVLFGAVCEWAGVQPGEAGLSAHDMAELIEAPGAVGLRHWKGRLARRRSDRRVAALIERVRSGTSEARPGTALQVVAHHRDLEGHLLEPEVAAVELINLLRPTVAVSRYVVFVALALHSYPAARAGVADGSIEASWFVQEVRRYFPFFPVVAARVRETFEWQGFTFPAGTRVLLDLYGINHDPRIWGDPQQFRPGRFAEREPGPFELVPQGGGEAWSGHRCPGEGPVVALMQAALNFLVNEVEYDVPPQDLRVKHSRMPAGPESGFRIANVRPRAAVAR